VKFTVTIEVGSLKEVVEGYLVRMFSNALEQLFHSLGAEIGARSLSIPQSDNRD
jgi:hypothetical protein